MPTSQFFRNVLKAAGKGVQTIPRRLLEPEEAPIGGSVGSNRMRMGPVAFETLQVFTNSPSV